jgi:hypothetical protein
VGGSRFDHLDVRIEFFQGLIDTIQPLIYAPELRLDPVFRIVKPLADPSHLQDFAHTHLEISSHISRHRGHFVELDPPNLAITDDNKKFSQLDSTTYLQFLRSPIRPQSTLKPERDW